MARGFSSGVLWGGVIGLGLTGVASVLMPLPTSPVVSDVAPNAVEAPARIETASSGESGSQADRSLITGQVAPQTQMPETDAVPTLDAEALAPAEQPQTGVTENLQAPASGVETAAVDVAGDAPVLPNPLALAPMAPQPVDDVAISTEPAAPPAPSTDRVAGDFAAPAQPAMTDATADSDVGVAATDSEDVASAGVPQTLPAPGTGGETGSLVESTVSAPLTQPAQDAAQAVASQVKPIDPPANVVAALPAQTDDAPQTVVPQKPDAGQQEGELDVAQDAAEEVIPQENITPETAEADTTATTSETAENQTAETGASNTETAQVAPAETQVAPTPTETDVAETAPAQQPRPSATDRDTQTGAATNAVVRRRIGTPSITLTDRNTGVNINRPTNVDAQIEPATAVNEVVDTSDQPPVKQHAEAFDWMDEKPLMSIVLIDDGSSAVTGADAIAALDSFPYALSVAVDSGLSDAADRMSIYRAAGFEVLAMIDLPDGAQPTDAETTLGAILPRMNEVVGVLEGTNGGLQSSRPVADQVTAILAQTGHGLVTQDRGLNTMPKLARKEGVPADPVFRDFDSKGQNAQVIRRFLDQAAFKAGQEGAVVMLGRMRPDTVSALLLWGLQDRAGKVALAPISTLLTRDQN